MFFDSTECLHCAIVAEIGRRLERGLTTGQQAIDSLVAAVADILATAPADRAQEMLDAVVSELPAAEARSRQSIAKGAAVRR